jgi:hypothetical protein
MPALIESRLALALVKARRSAAGSASSATMAASSWAPSCCLSSWGNGGGVGGAAAGVPDWLPGCPAPSVAGMPPCIASSASITSALPLRQPGSRGGSGTRRRRPRQRPQHPGSSGRPPAHLLSCGTCRASALYWM